MSLPELFIIAVGLSMDAFAVAVCIGLTMSGAIGKKSLIVGLYFGAFQAFMPFAGYMLATRFADVIVDFDHWIAFVLLCFIGGRMAAGSLKKEEDSAGEAPSGQRSDKACPNGEQRTKEAEASLKPAQMLPLAVATSIDALAVGVSFAFLRVDIVPAVSFIGVTTFALSAVGVKIGNVFGIRFKSKAEFAGGVILVLMGFKILLEHLGIIAF